MLTALCTVCLELLRRNQHLKRSHFITYSGSLLLVLGSRSSGFQHTLGNGERKIAELKRIEWKLQQCGFTYKQKIVLFIYFQRNSLYDGTFNSIIKDWNSEVQISNWRNCCLQTHQLCLGLKLDRR